MPYLDKLNLIDAMHSAPASMSVCMNTDECFGMMRMKQMMIHLVSSFPESEVKPMIRCAECQHCKLLGLDAADEPVLACDIHHCRFSEHERWVNATDYCSWAIRKEQP